MDRLMREGIKTLNELLGEKSGWLLDLAVREQEAFDSLPESLREGVDSHVATLLGSASSLLELARDDLAKVLSATDDGRG